jgi:hypothetical protein
MIRKNFSNKINNYWLVSSHHYGIKNLQKIIDVGCGSGYKLVKYLGDYETIGFET